MFAIWNFPRRSRRSVPARFHQRLLIVAASVLCSAATGAHVMAQSRILVGSNFIWYHLGSTECATGRTEAARDPFAVVTAYTRPEGRSEVNKALTLMRQHGQAVIALGLFHEHGASGKNTILDSSGGGPSPDVAQALSALFTTIVDLDFKVLYLRFFPFGKNATPVSNDRSLSLEPDLYQENLSFIERVLQLTNGRQIEVITDLCNECSPSSPDFDNPKDRRQARLMVYVRHLWSDYVRKYGPDHTVGFSIIPDKFRVANLPAVYAPAGVRPQTLDLHFYPSNAEVDLLRCRQDPGKPGCAMMQECLRSPGSEMCRATFTGSLFDDVARQLSGLGFHMPWIVGETYYNDPKSAMYLANGINLTHQEVRYIVQWPLRRASNGAPSDCDDPRKGGGVNIGTPFNIDAYTDVH
jgi:hypothetical protein